MHKHFNSLLIIVSLAIVLVSCEKEIPATPMDLNEANIIPKPMTLESTGSSFRFFEKTGITFTPSNEELKKLAVYLQTKLKPATGLALPVAPFKKAKNNINLSLSDEKDLGKEGYLLNIEERSISLTANTTEGIFRGLQTIRQLLPSDIEKPSRQEREWLIPSGRITDQPTLAYRGSMLDISRHFFGLPVLKRYIDLIAYHKMNTLHIHIADDQGWRIEIKSWPKLTEIGGSTEVGGGTGGFLTQEQYKELVAYAAAQYITIIPEIDMPGHTNAALASYAELNCDGKARKLYTGTNVGFSTLCVRKEITYKFLNDVISEVAAITPGPYIHIGGDESDATEEEDYIYFINRVQDIVNSHGKNMMGWDDIAAGKLKSTSLAQHWAKIENAKEAVHQNVKLVMSPATKAYIDMKYDSTTRLGLNWAAYIEVDDGYQWDPQTFIEGVPANSIHGIETPLWSETVESMEDIEFLAFPRLCGYAEIGWTPAKDRSWSEYSKRLVAHGQRLENMKVNFYKSPKVQWELESQLKK